MQDIIIKLTQISNILTLTAADLNESGKGDHAGALLVAHSQLGKQIQCLIWAADSQKGGASA
jgi:hypothetical protein